MPQRCTTEERFSLAHKFLIGGEKEMRAMGVGSRNLNVHSKTDLYVKLTSVYVTEGIGFKLFSLYDAQE